MALVFLKSKRKQVGCKFVNKLSIYLDNLYLLTNHSHQANLKSEGRLGRTTISWVDAV